MLPSISPAQQIGVAVLLVAVLLWLAGFGRLVRGARFPHRPEPEPRVAGLAGLAAIPAQRRAEAHPMESVELTEAEEEAFASLVRSIRTLPQR
ncbi:hypothetical protein HYE82_01565 [Streptomyces sp. BR123]|uniref:hypothetical protein n=1 Tax=Streptomyces sp. BR123 TaxID=2749828 RepID=UPI0015C48B48|nr:hypothetical protein [Streptomyces sp. BR123]NXY93129.1 hypothetical protein [Streptomyces sp. BR123]